MNRNSSQMDALLTAKKYSSYNNNNITKGVKTSTNDPVTIRASYIQRDNATSSINLQTQRKSGSVVGQMVGSGISSTNFAKYDHIKAKVKSRPNNATSTTVQNKFHQKKASMFEVLGRSGQGQAPSQHTKRGTEHKQPVFYQVDLTENDEGQALKAHFEQPKRSTKQPKASFDQQLQTMQEQVIKNEEPKSQSASPTKWSPSKRALYQSRSMQTFHLSESRGKQPFLPEKRLFGVERESS